jgi:hypothetical protein
MAASLIDNSAAEWNQGNATFLFSHPFLATQVRGASTFCHEYSVIGIQCSTFLQTVLLHVYFLFIYLKFCITKKNPLFIVMKKNNNEMFF